MNAPLRAPLQFDIRGLVQAVADNQTPDRFACVMTSAQWDMLAGYLQPFALAAGQPLIEQGASDRTLYLIESGALSVHYEDDKGRIRLAMVSAGSVVGEGAFFTRLPRSATVQAAGPCKMWSLTPIRFTELSNRHPAIALAVSMALGTVVSRRLVNKPKRVAVT